MAGKKAKRDPAGFEDVARPARGEQSFDALCAVAARLFGADAAALCLNAAGVTQIIGSCGLAVRLRRYVWDFSAVRYQPEDLVLVPNCETHVDAQRAAHALGLQTARLFVRAPVDRGEDYNLALIVLGKTAAERFSPRQKGLLQELTALMRESFAPVRQMLLDPDNDVTVASPLADILRVVETAEHPEIVLDAGLVTRAASPRVAAYAGVPGEALVGRPLVETEMPAAQTIASVARRALDLRLSPPDIEIVREEDGQRRVFQLTVSPFSPSDTTDYFALARMREVTALDALARRVSISVDRSTPHRAAPREPTLAFLDETLVRRRSIRTRHDLSYITLRAWRRPIRDYQIKALRALKGNIPEELPRFIAGELAQEARSLIGLTAFRAVVPVPCGHSTGPCLSLEIARALAAELGAPVVQAFVTRHRPGVSHPKDNARRPPLALSREVGEPLILVDDVATSGSHLEEASQLLRPHCGVLLALAWIGGDAV